MGQRHWQHARCEQLLLQSCRTAQSQATAHYLPVSGVSVEDPTLYLWRMPTAIKQQVCYTGSISSHHHTP
jgi:hypothetical protein